MGNQVLTHTRAAKARAETQNLDTWKLGRVDKRMQKHPVRQRRISSRDFRPQGLGKDLQETASSPQASSWLEVHGSPPCSSSIHHPWPFPCSSSKCRWLRASPECSPRSHVKCLSTISKVLSLGARQRTNKVLVVGGVKNSSKNKMK